MPLGPSHLVSGSPVVSLGPHCPKRQDKRTGAVHDLAEFLKLRSSRQRLGVRLPSTAFPLRKFDEVANPSPHHHKAPDFFPSTAFRDATQVMVSARVGPAETVW